MVKRMDCSSDSNKLNSSATQKPLTLNPPINLSAKRMISALMTNKNNPSVTTVIGSVKIIKIGFTIAFNNPKTIATIMADVKVTSLTPGRKYDKINTARAVSKIRRMRFMVFGYCVIKLQNS